MDPEKDMPVELRQKIEKFYPRDIRCVCSRLTFSQQHVAFDNDHLPLNLPPSLSGVSLNFPKEYIFVQVIPPGLRETVMSLERYGPDGQYALTKGWWYLVRTENFVAGNRVRIWSFRDVNGRLWFAMHFV